jgi:hypothetical protein
MRVEEFVYLIENHADLQKFSHRIDLIIEASYPRKRE